MAEGVDSESTSSSEHSGERPASWFIALKRYVQETDVCSLNLSSMKLRTPEVANILEFLADSQVTELNLSDNDFQSGIEPLPRLLIKTKVNKLDISSCKLSFSHLLSLMKISKETKVTNIDVSKNPCYAYGREKHDLTFISHLVESPLTVLNLAESISFNNREVMLLFVQALRNTSLTHLNLKGAFRNLGSVDSSIPLFFELKHTSITHLNLADCTIGKCDFKNIGESLRDSKLVELDLSSNEITAFQMNHLFQALIGSKITTLNLASNNILGDNNFGVLLKETQITHLDLSKNGLHYGREMFSPPDFLRDSSLETLKLSQCELEDDTGVPLMKSIMFSKLKEIDFHNNYLSLSSIRTFAEIVKDTSINNFNFSADGDIQSDSLDQALVLIGELSVESKIKHLHVGGRCGNRPPQFLVIAEFLKKLTNSSVTHFHSWYKELGVNGVEIISQALKETPITHLNLRYNEIGDGLGSLAANLVLTSITHLNLKGNNINDEGVKVLAECLKRSCIVDLDLSKNDITCEGAVALAFFLRDAIVFNLKLNKNKIGNKGLKALADHSKPNLISSLDVCGNPGDVFIVEEALWNNQRLVYELINAFKRISPESINSVLQLESLVGISDIDLFLDECLSFYNTVVKNPSATSILAREESILLSGDEIALFLFETFPQKFTEFLAINIEADPLQHVNFLKKVENLGLSKIIELLLLNRAVYTIDELHGILHPYVYELLIKYKILICNLDVDPEGIKRIIKYFTDSTHIEGAADVVRILQTTKP